MYTVPLTTSFKHYPGTTLLCVSCLTNSVSITVPVSCVLKFFVEPGPEPTFSLKTKPCSLYRSLTRIESKLEVNMAVTRVWSNANINSLDKIYSKRLQIHISNLKHMFQALTDFRGKMRRLTKPLWSYK